MKMNCSLVSLKLKNGLTDKNSFFLVKFVIVKTKLAPIKKKISVGLPDKSNICK